jgi:hypothetical protein
MYNEPYYSFVKKFHDETDMVITEIDSPLDPKIKIGIHAGYKKLVEKHIDNLDKMITKILTENPLIDYILFTGHSLGASIVQLSLFYLLAIKKNKQLLEKIKNIKLFTTGAIRIGNYALSEWWNIQEFKPQIFNIYGDLDTYAVTPGVGVEKNHKPYTSVNPDDFFPINSILYDSYLKNQIVNKEKIIEFNNTHFDYIHAIKQNEIIFHEFSEYELVFEKYL